MAEQQGPQQHPIPQQVLGVQFRLVGDLTVKQFAYLAGGGLFGYLFFISGFFAPLRLALTALSVLGGVGLAMVPVQDQPMDQWVVNLFNAIYAPTRWVWRKTAEPLEFLTLPTSELARPVEKDVSPEEARRRLEEYLATVREEEALEPIDLAEKERLDAINIGIHELAPTAPPLVPPAVSRVEPSPAPEQIRYGVDIEEPLVPPVTLTAPPAPTVAERPAMDVTIEEPTVPERPTPPSLPAQAGPPRAARPLPLVLQRRSEEIAEEPTLASTINYTTEPVLKLQRGTSITYMTTLRNVKVGRKFRPIPAGEVSFAPAKERIITVEDRPLPTFPEPTAPPAPSVETLPPPVPEAPLPAQADLPAPPKPEEKVEVEKPPPLRIKPARLALLKEKPKPSPPEAKVNVIHGFVYDEKRKSVEGTLVAIKDSTGTVVLAAKTDQLGRFTSSPLPNGNYLVELPKTKQPFAIIRIELTGGKVPPLEIRPK